MTSQATSQTAAEARDRRTSTARLAYPLGNSQVVFDAVNDRLLSLNDTAYRIWQAWHRGLDARQISQELAEHFDAPAERLLHDVEQTLAHWQQPPQSAPSHSEGPWGLPARAWLEQAPVMRQCAAQADYCIQDSRFRLHFGTRAIADALAPLFAHYAGDDPGSTAVDYQIEDLGETIRLRQDCRVIYEGPSLDMAAINLMYEVLLSGFRETDPLCALHAAGVGRDGQCLLMPGIAGAGKSTLTAALIQRGLEYLSDDTVPITRSNHQALALRPPLCVKDGSVSILEPRYPELADARVFKRTDQTVRYLTPPATGNATSYKARALLFPSYQPGAPTRLAELAIEDALSLILDAGIFATQPRDTDQLGELVEWLAGLHCYQLSYGRLDEACSEILKLFDNPDVFTSNPPGMQLEVATA